MQLKQYQFLILATFFLMFAACKKEDASEETPKDTFELIPSSDQYTTTCGKLLEVPYSAYYERTRLDNRTDTWVKATLIANNTGDTNFYYLGLYYAKALPYLRMVVPHKAGLITVRLQLLVDNEPKGRPKDINITINNATVDYRPLIQSSFTDYAIGKDNSIVLYYNLLRISEDGSITEPLEPVIGSGSTLNTSTDDGRFLFLTPEGVVKTYDPITKEINQYDLGGAAPSVKVARDNFFYPVKLGNETYSLNISQKTDLLNRKTLNYFQGLPYYLPLKTGGLLVIDGMGSQAFLSDNDTSTVFTNVYLPEPSSLLQYIGNDLFLVGANAVYRSTDDAKTWAKVGNLPALSGRSIYKVAMTHQHFYFGIAETGNIECKSVLITNSLTDLSYKESIVPLPFRNMAPLYNGDLVLNCANELTYLFKP